MNVLLLSWFTSLTFSFSSGFSPVTRYSTGMKPFQRFTPSRPTFLICAAPKTVQPSTGLKPR